MSKNGFYVQLHLHTAESSNCGHASAAEMVRACKEAGYDLIAITDHFINSNLRCDMDLPWAEKVRHQFLGYHAAKAEGDRIGLEVIPGWETFSGGLFNESPNSGIRGPELLTYGLDEAFLLANPDIADAPYHEYIRRVADAGGYIIHAHPFRKAHYIPEFTPDPLSVEAYEVYNAQNKAPEWNTLALKDAEAHGLLKFAGSDAHWAQHVTGGAMRFSRPVHSAAEIFEAMRSGEGEIVEVIPKAEDL